MATVHFIWWGPYKERLCVETPNSVANTSKDHQIVFWCKSTESSVFAHYLDLRINIRACDSIKEIVGDGIYYSPANKQLRKCLDDAQEVLNYLASVRAFSAAKDLLSLVILYAHGGYYLDTTTVISPGTEGSKLNDSLKYSGNGPRVPVLGLDKNGKFEPQDMTHQWLLQTAASIIYGGDIDSGVPESYVPTVDVWAMYSPPQHASVELMLWSYVSRCNRMGLYPGGKTDVPLNFAAKIGDEIMTGGGREGLIGTLIISSVYDGLLRECGGDAEKMRNIDGSTLYWKAIEIEMSSAQKKFTVPSLGIEKVHQNSWRSL